MAPNETYKVTSFQPAFTAQNRIAIGMHLGTLSKILVEAGDENAPHFTPPNQPNRDAPRFVAVDGTVWYRPDLRVSDRPSSAGPYVWFLKDAENVVRLEFQLEEVGPAGLPANARPFATTIDSLSLEWHDEDGAHSRAFANPTIDAAADAGHQPHFLVHCGDKLARDEVQTLYHALAGSAGSTANPHLTVGLSYGYWIDTESDDGDGGVVSEPDERLPKRRPGGRERLPGLGRAFEGRSASATRPATAAVANRPAASSVAMAVAGTAGPSAVAVTAVAPIAAGAFRGKAMRASLVNRGSIDDIVNRRRQRTGQRDFKRVSYTRSIVFGFDENLEANAPIYRAIKGEHLATEWTSTVNGWLRRADYPNTVYRLPDQIRLAFNADLGVPHVLPTLYRDEKGDANVRVVMRLLPWHDPAALVAICDDLGTAPNIVVGGYESASLRFTGAFPDQIHALAGTEVPITLETGAEVTLDLASGLYSLLCGLLTSAVGLTGSVTVTLGQTKPADGSAPQPIVREVPVLLTFDKPAALPLDVSVPADAVSPAQFTLSNGSGAPVTVGGCEPRLLQYDDNSVVPLEVFKGKATGGVPASLAPAATATVGIAPVDPADVPLWNAVLAQFLDIHLDLDPAAALTRIHEVAPSGSIEWKLEIECRPLAVTPPPVKFASVIAIDVRITRQDGGHDVVHLDRDKPTAEISMQKTLTEMLAGEGAIGSYTYAVRNLYDDHPGKWAEPIAEEGSTLSVYPNDPAGD